MGNKTSSGSKILDTLNQEYSLEKLKSVPKSEQSLFVDILEKELKLKGLTFNDVLAFNDAYNKDLKLYGFETFASYGSLELIKKITKDYKTDIYINETKDSYFSHWSDVAETIIKAVYIAIEKGNSCIVEYLLGQLFFNMETTYQYIRSGINK